jgi:hypothetical protein
LLWIASVWTIGCSSSRESPPSPDCGCDEEPDSGECVDTDVPEPDGGVPGWRMTWAVQAGGDKNTSVPADIAWDLSPLSDSSVLVTGRYVAEGLFGAGEPNETLLWSFGFPSETNTNCFIARYGNKGELLWAEGYGGAGIEAGGQGISEEVDDSFLTIGAYEEAMTIGYGEPNQTSLSADSFETSGTYSHVLARYSTDGVFEWAIRASDAAWNSALYGIASLPDGSIVVAGSFTVGIAFAPGTPEEVVFTTAGDADTVIARFAADGSLLWAKQITGQGRESAMSVARALGGSLLVAGRYQQTIVLGAGEENETSLTCGSDEPDAGEEEDENCPFLAAYSEDGALLWAKDLGFSCRPMLLPKVVAAPDGGFAISGGFAGTGVLGAGEPNETIIGPTTGDDFDVVVARYDDDGMLLWARQVVGETEDWGSIQRYPQYTMAFLDSGELAVVGIYKGAPVFGLGEPHETTLPSEYDYQIFIALHYPNGNLAWVIDQGGPSNNDAAMSVASYGDGTFFVGGSFGGTATFGTSPEDEKTMTSSGDSDIFVLRFDRTED